MDPCAPLGDKKMFFTDDKTTTLREAVAVGTIIMAASTLVRVKEKTTPKGDVIELARTAGVLAAKKTPELIPYCHPLPLDGVKVDFELIENGIRVTALVKTIWKTGVEMEALTAVSIATLTLYDMLKPIDQNLEITSIKLLTKKGGKTDFKENIPKGLKIAVIVTSDGTHQGIRQDQSGKLICKRLLSMGLEPQEYLILPDEKEKIQSTLLRLCEENFQLIVTTGGTGLGPRDVTVEATASVIDREVPGAAEAMRSFGQERTPYAMLSRGLVGLRGKCLIINLPGSSKGVDESMNAIFPGVLHSYKMMGGGGH